LSGRDWQALPGAASLGSQARLSWAATRLESPAGLRFEWELRKASANLKKHGISFEEAKSVFYDENAKLISDPDHSDYFGS
jgi:hypothetical protein